MYAPCGLRWVVALLLLLLLSVRGLMTVCARVCMCADYLLSNNHVNYLIKAPFDASHGDLLAYYISFLRTMSMQLTDETIQFFFNSVTHSAAYLCRFTLSVSRTHAPQQLTWVALLGFAARSHR